MVDTETANVAFTVLTFLANAGFLALAVIGITVTTHGRIGARARRVVTIIGRRAVPLAAVVAAVTTAGSLFYSEVKSFIPCELCWYQRICMYPLVAIFVVGLLRRDRAVGWYAAPFVVIGAPLALYHWLVERVPSLSSSTSCSIYVPCTVPPFEELGYVTLAFMDMSAFLLIGALLLTERIPERSPREITP